MSVRIDSSDPAIQQAINDIKVPNGTTRWICFDYVAKTYNKLKVVDTGTGGLDEMLEYLNDGKILYFFIWFDINKTRKFAYISWCGEGVTGMKKGLFNNHAQDVGFLFKSFHAQINARSEKDVKEQLIVDRLTKATGASYDSGAKIQGSSTKLVPASVAQGREQATKSNAKVRTFEKTQGTDQSTENKPSSSTITYETRQVDQSTESKPASSSLRYEQSKLDQSTESKPAPSTLPGTRPNPSNPNTTTPSSLKARFEQPQQSAPPSRPIPGKLGAKNTVPPPKNEPVLPPKNEPVLPPKVQPPPPKIPEPVFVPEPEPTFEEPAQESYEEPVQQSYEEPVQESYEEPVQESYEEPVQESYEEPVQESYEEPAQESYEGGDYSQPAASGGVSAKALYDYDAENPDDLSFKEGDIIMVLDQSDPSGWWEGEIGGKTGFFPSNFVELQ